MNTQFSKSSFFDHDAFVRRLKQCRDALGISGAAMARSAGVTKQTFSGYLNSGRVPGADVLGRWVAELRVNANWLLTGEGEMLCPRPAEKDAGRGMEEGPALSPAQGGGGAEAKGGGFWIKATQVNLPLPLTGFAECDGRGWCGRTVRVAAISPPVLGPEWLAVLAAGNAMLPHGIREGYVVFCDPAQPPVADEAVFVQRADGSATLKVFAGQLADGWILLRGWSEPDAAGGQEPFEERVAPGDIRCMAPVIYVRRRL